jgi:hypothetical protein
VTLLVSAFAHPPGSARAAPAPLFLTSGRFGRRLARFLPTVKRTGNFRRTELLNRLKSMLPEKSFELLTLNQVGIMMEPRLSAAAFAYAAVLDRLQYGTIPADLANDVLRDQAANVAVALSAKPQKWFEYWSELPANPADRLQPFAKGLALGWQSRW